MSVPTTPPETPEWIHSGPAAWHHPILGLLVFGVLGEGVRLALNLDFSRDWDWLPWMVWPIATLSLLVGLSRRLPVQSMVAAAVVGGGMLYGADWLDVQTGLPFGPRQFAIPVNGEPNLVPPWMPCLWLTLLLTCRGVSRLVLKRHRDWEYYGLGVLGLSCCLVTAELRLLEPVAQYGGWWRWAESKSWVAGGAPAVYWLGSWTVTLLTLAFITPWLLNKRPVPQPVDFHPVWIWLLLAVWIAEHQWAAQDLNGLFANGAFCLGVLIAVWRGVAPKKSLPV